MKEIDLSFSRDFKDYLRTIEKLNENTVGRSIGFLKTIVRDAKSEGLEVSPQLDKIKASKIKAHIIYLNEEELRSIKNLDLSDSEHLEIARDWLIVGSYTGQRVSDFLRFTTNNIKDGFIEFVQMKTGKKTVVPLHPYVQDVLQKYDDKFPRKMSSQRFNEHIKKVCKRAGLKSVIPGSMLNKDTNRKEVGKYPKYKLVTSHICRRSFATNHYGRLPTSVIMAITNHATERQFLDYIGKQQRDQAEELREYWNSLKSDKVVSINRGAL